MISSNSAFQSATNQVLVSGTKTNIKSHSPSQQYRLIWHFQPLTKNQIQSMISFCCFCCNSKKQRQLAWSFFFELWQQQKSKTKIFCIGSRFQSPAELTKEIKLNAKIQICEEFDSIVAALLDKAAGETGKNSSQTASEPSSHVQRNLQNFRFKCQQPKFSKLNIGNENKCNGQNQCYQMCQSGIFLAISNNLGISLQPSLIRYDFEF